MIGLITPSAFSENPEITISGGATGGDCTTIGTWNPNTRTCTLTSDVSTPIVVTGCGITLDGDGHTVNIPPEGFNTQDQRNDYYQKYSPAYGIAGVYFEPDFCDASDIGHTSTIKNFVISIL